MANFIRQKFCLEHELIKKRQNLIELADQQTQALSTSVKWMRVAIYFAERAFVNPNLLRTRPFNWLLNSVLEMPKKGGLTTFFQSLFKGNP